MYEEKQLRLWLMVIPFWVVHIFGAHSIFVQDNFINVVQESVSIKYCCPLSELEELVYTKFIKLINTDKINDLRRTLYCCLSTDSNISGIIKEVHVKEINFNSKMMLCDSSYENKESRLTKDLYSSECIYYCHCADDDWPLNSYSLL